jgi:hypothetical protein
MKFLSSELGFVFTDRKSRANLRALLKYFLLLALLITSDPVIFHLLTLHVEEERHSWITGSQPPTPKACTGRFGSWRLGVGG